MSTSRTLAVGIDMQGAEAVLVTAQRGGSAAGVKRVPASDVAQYVSNQARVGVTMPLRESVGRWLQTPYASPRKARKVLPTVLDIQLPFALDACVYDFVSERKSDAGKIEALAVAARHPAIAASLKAWGALGVEPAVLDHEGLALWTQSLLELPRRDGEGEIRAVIYAGLDRGSVAFGKAGDYVNSHTCSLDQPLQLRRLLRAAFGESEAPVSWVWSGPRAADPAFEPRRLAIEALAPGASVIVADPASFLARALARRVGHADSLFCNFRAGLYADERDVKASSRTLGRVAVMTLVAGLLLWAGAALSRHGAVSAKRAGREQFRSIYMQVVGPNAGPEQDEHAITVARRAVDERARRLAALEPMLGRSLTEPLLELISAADPAQLQIHECRLSATEWYVAGQVSARAAAEVLREAAERSGYKTSLQWGTTAGAGDAGQLFVLETGGKP